MVLPLIVAHGKPSQPFHLRIVIHQQADSVILEYRRLRVPKLACHKNNNTIQLFMSSDPHEIFGIACLGMAVLSTVWLFLAGNWSKYLGAGGAAVGAIIVAGIWLADHLPWIWRIHQITMLCWLMTFVMMGVGVAFALRQQGTSKWLSVIVGLSALALNACSILGFLWIATVSAGGV